MPLNEKNEFSKQLDARVEQVEADKKDLIANIKKAATLAELKTVLQNCNQERVEVDGTLRDIKNQNALIDRYYTDCKKFFAEHHYEDIYFYSIPRAKYSSNLVDADNSPIKEKLQGLLKMECFKEREAEKAAYVKALADKAAAEKAAAEKAAAEKAAAEKAAAEKAAADKAAVKTVAVENVAKTYTPAAAGNGAGAATPAKSEMAARIAAWNAKTTTTATSTQVAKYKN